MAKKKTKARAKKTAAPKRGSPAPLGVRATLERARAASRTLASLPGEPRSKALAKFAELLSQRRQALFAANAKDLREQKGKIADAVYQRLKLDADKLAPVIQGIQELAQRPDPVGRVLE